MKVLLVNGSPHPQGCTARALKEVEQILVAEGVECETINVGNKDIRGCIGCYYCRQHGKCVFDDIVNETAPKLEEADGIIVGTPTYYAHANGGVITYLDRLFFSTPFSKAMKAGATVVSSRRAGSTSAFEEINKYFTISSMPIVSSTYWNEVHGFSPDDVEKDAEGLQTMRNLARNFTFILRAIKAEKEKSGGLPEQEKGNFTNFIR